MLKKIKKIIKKWINKIGELQILRNHVGGFIHSNNCLEADVGRPTKKEKRINRKVSEIERVEQEREDVLCTLPAVVQDDEINK